MRRRHPTRRIRFGSASTSKRCWQTSKTEPTTSGRLSKARENTMLGDNPAGRGSALPKVIPERIREAREARGLTAEAFGDLLGMSRAAVALYETGQVGPSP